MSKAGFGGRGWVRLWRHISRPSWFVCHASPITHPSLASGVRCGMWDGGAGRVRRAGLGGGGGAGGGGGGGRAAPRRPEPAQRARNKYIAPHKIQREASNGVKEIQ